LGLATHVRDVNKDTARISEEILSRIEEVDHKVASNGRALSELKGKPNAMMLSRSR
jgi:hypothetical protein